MVLSHPPPNRAQNSPFSPEVPGVPAVPLKPGVCPISSSSPLPCAQNHFAHATGLEQVFGGSKIFFCIATERNNLLKHADSLVLNKGTWAAFVKVTGHGGMV